MTGNVGLQAVYEPISLFSPLQALDHLFIHDWTLHHALALKTCSNLTTEKTKEECRKGGGMGAMTLSQLQHDRNVQFLADLY